MTTALLMAAGIAACVAVVLRLTLWRSHPGSRSMTVTLALLMAAALLTQPAVIDNEWADRATPPEIRLANFSNLLGDLIAVAAAVCLVLTVGKAWGRRYLVRRTVAVGAVVGVALIVLYGFSDANLEATSYIGQLGGLATVYSLVVAITLLVANIAVLASLVYSFPVTARATRIALLPMMCGAAIGAALVVLLIAGHVRPDPYGEWYVDWAWPMAAVMVFAYALSGILGYWQLRNQR